MATIDELGDDVRALVAALRSTDINAHIRVLEQHKFTFDKISADLNRLRDDHDKMRTGYSTMTTDIALLQRSVRDLSPQRDREQWRRGLEIIERYGAIAVALYAVYAATWEK